MIGPSDNGHARDVAIYQMIMTSYHNTLLGLETIPHISSFIFFCEEPISTEARSMCPLERMSA